LHHAVEFTKGVNTVPLETKVIGAIPADSKENKEVGRVFAKLYRPTLRGTVIVSGD